MKKIAAFALTLVLPTVFCLESVSASPTRRVDPGTQTVRVFSQKDLWQGYNIFKKDCKSCHFRGNDKGATFLYAESKDSEEWNQVFFEKLPACAKNGSWKQLGREERLILNDYLYRYAFGTYDPNNAADSGCN